MSFGSPGRYRGCEQSFEFLNPEERFREVVKLGWTELTAEEIEGTEPLGV